MKMCVEGASLTAEPEHSEIGARARIVVADDQPDVRTALGLLLKAEGHAVEAVGSPAALLEAMQRGADLVLMDLNYTRDTTSGAEGLDLLRRLRERHPATPVLVMTAWGSIELAVEAMRRGARSFVLKPWENGALQRLVEAELRESARRAAGSVGGARSPGDTRDAGSARDLAVASRVQAELLPRTKPPLANLEYAGLCLQAGAVGGDLYDFLPLGHGPRGLRPRRRVGQGRGRGPADRPPPGAPAQPGRARPRRPRGLPHRRERAVPGVHGARALRDAVLRRLRRGVTGAAVRELRTQPSGAAGGRRILVAALAHGARGRPAVGVAGDTWPSSSWPRATSC